MAKNVTVLLDRYFKTKLEPFSGDEFRAYLADRKIKLGLEDVANLLFNNDFIFALQDNHFITRAGAFTNRVFSFKPSLEEVNAHAFVPGHRFMPFLNPAVYPYEAAVMVQGKFVERKEVEISTNTALDIHSLLGEGYIIPYLFDDPSNDSFTIQSFTQNSLPKTLKLSGFSLEPLIEAGFKYGDRVLCRVVDWADNVVEITFDKWSNTSQINNETIERNQWYKDFEDGMLRVIKKLGPCGSIEAQLAYLFLEEQATLCKMNCGSCEEFLKYTKKIGFKPYGVESRIWKVDEAVSYVGEWNRELAEAHRLPEIDNLFNERIYDAFIRDELYRTNKNPDFESLARNMVPDCLPISEDEFKFLLLNLKKRTTIILKDYTKFNDIAVSQVRKRLLAFFSKVRNLMCTLAVSELDLSEYPQESLIMLDQIADHLIRMIEEMEMWPQKFTQQEEEINVSLDGMIETFSDIECDLKINEKDKNKSGFKLVK